MECVDIMECNVQKYWNGMERDGMVWDERTHDTPALEDQPPLPSPSLNCAFDDAPMRVDCSISLSFLSGFLRRRYGYP